MSKKRKPTVDRATYEALVQDLATPERLAREAGRLIERLRDEPLLVAVRFEADALGGAAREGLERFLSDDARAQAIGKLVREADLESTLIHISLGFEEAREIALPLEAALHGPIEAAKAAKRRQALVGVGRTAPRAEESM